MNHANRHILFGADGHPTLELLRQYQEGLLSPALSHQLERHLLDCELCADIVEGMEISGEAQTKIAVDDIKQRMAAKDEKRRVVLWYQDWRAVAAVFVLICSAVMVFYHQYTNLQTAPETIAVKQSETIVAPSISYAPPVLKQDQETITETEAISPPTIAQAEKAKRTITANSTITEVADEEIIEPDDFSVAGITEDVKNEEEAIEELTLGYNNDSAVRIAIVKPKTKIAAPALPRMSLERSLAGSVAGVSVQRNAAGKKQVQGTVLDEHGNPLPGVTVQVKGTKQGVSTDKDGNFSLQVPADKNVLSFRYIGFATKEQQIDTATNLLAINLQPDSRQLSEVVVTGYEKSTAAPVIEKPKPTIGQRAYKLYLKNEQRPLTTNSIGRVIVGFTVSEKGQIENVHVLRSLNSEADAEAVRLVQQGPAWEPAKQNGSLVAQQVKVVVRFR